MGQTVANGVRRSSINSSPDLNDAPTGTVSRALPPSLASVREARDVVRRVLIGWRAEEIFDDVVLVASELVANALRHGIRLDPALPQGSSARDSAVRISLVSTGTHVICAVTDPSAELPIRRSSDPMAGSGHGLQLVESLSLCWGWTVFDHDDDPSFNSSAVDDRIVETSALEASIQESAILEKRAVENPVVEHRAVEHRPAGKVKGKSVWAIFPLRLPAPIRIVGAA